MWTEQPPAEGIVDGIVVLAPPSQKQLAAWFEEFKRDASLQQQFRERYFLMRRNYKSRVRWASNQWFFRNATREQLSTFECYL